MSGIGLEEEALPSHREALDQGRLKGGIIQAHLKWAVERHGAEVTEAIRSSVSEQTAKVVLGPVLATLWYPFRTLIELDRALAKISGDDQAATYHELGRYSAEINLTTIYKAFAHGQPHEFFRREARLHRQFLDFGEVVYSQSEPTACRLTMREYPCYSKVFCQSAEGYYERAAELHGGDSVRVAESECICEGADGCTYEIAWS
jgi:uncharacterized protein (TIGR02265 family)